MFSACRSTLRRALVSNNLRRGISHAKESDLSTSYVGAPDVYSLDMNSYISEESKSVQQPQTTTLKNGVQVVSTNSSTKGNSAVSVVVNAGSRFENYSNNGVSHFVERFFFSGTNNRSYLRLVTDLQKTGANVSAQAGREDIVYQFESLREATPQVLEIVADSILQSRLHPWDLTPKQEAVKGDIQAFSETPELLLNEALHQTAFQSLTLGRSLLCPPHNLKKINTNTVKEYMDTLFVPSRIKLVGTNIDHSTLVQMAESLFGQINTTPSTTFKPDTSASEYLGGTLRLHEQRHGDSCASAIAFQGSSTTSKDYQALNVLVNVLGSGVGHYVPRTSPKNSTLGRAVKQYQLASARAFNFGYSDNGLFGVFLVGKGQNISNASDAVISALRDISNGSVSDADLNNAKNQTLIQFGQSVECNVGLNDFYARFNNLQEQSQNISGVSAQDLARVAAKLLKSAPTFVSYGNLDGLTPRVKL